METLIDISIEKSDLYKKYHSTLELLKQLNNDKYETLETSYFKFKCLNLEFKF